MNIILQNKNIGLNISESALNFDFEKKRLQSAFWHISVVTVKKENYSDNKSLDVENLNILTWLFYKFFSHNLVDTKDLKSIQMISKNLKTPIKVLRQDIKNIFKKYSGIELGDNDQLVFKNKMEDFTSHTEYKNFRNAASIALREKDVQFEDAIAYLILNQRGEKLKDQIIDLREKTRDNFNLNKIPIGGYAGFEILGSKKDPIYCTPLMQMCCTAKNSSDDTLPLDDEFTLMIQMGARLSKKQYKAVMDVLNQRTSSNRLSAQRARVEKYFINNSDRIISEIN